MENSQITEKYLEEHHCMFSPTKSWKRIRFYLSLGQHLIFKDTLLNCGVIVSGNTKGYSEHMNLFKKYLSSSQCKICTEQDKKYILEKSQQLLQDTDDVPLPRVALVQNIGNCNTGRTYGRRSQYGSNQAFAFIVDLSVREL